MANHQLLDNVEHKDLKVITDRSAWYGDDVASAGIFPLEFRRVQAEYPIVFRKNEATGQFEALALFGFTSGENLFLDDSGWNASYIPLSIERQPFLIGFQSATENGVPTEVPVVHIDMDSPRISFTEGKPVFLEHGGHSPYLEHISSILMSIHRGYEYMTGFSSALTELDLLEPFSLEVGFRDASKQTLTGLHTFNEEVLKALDGASLGKLHAQGYLEHIYMVIASIVNVRSLVERKNERL